MGVLIDGKWTDGELPQETGETGQFKRADSVFRGRITADGSSGWLSLRPGSGGAIADMVLIGGAAFTRLPRAPSRRHCGSPRCSSRRRKARP